MTQTKQVKMRVQTCGAYYTCYDQERARRFVTQIKTTARLCLCILDLTPSLRYQRFKPPPISIG